LSESGEEGPCGWLKDRYGVSWQIVPSILPELMSDPVWAGRVTKAFMQMEKMDIKVLQQARVLIHRQRLEEDVRATGMAAALLMRQVIILCPRAALFTISF